MNPEIINCLSNDLVSRFILRSITDEIIENSEIKDNKTLMEVVLTVDGQQVNFVKTVESFFENIEEYIEEKATELARSRSLDHIEDLEDKTRKMFENLKSSMEDMLRDAGYKNVTLDDDYWNE